MVQMENKTINPIKLKQPFGEVLYSYILYTFSLINHVYELSCNIQSDVGARTPRCDSVARDNSGQ
jgi:hypothetical protein